MMSPKIDKTKLLKRSLLLLLLLATVGAFIVHKFVQQYGFSGIGEFISVYRHNSDLADQVEPVEMHLLLSDADYEFLKNRRDVALERGIQINDGEDTYVDCKVVQNGDTIKGEMRLKGHMTDHLEGEKWSFRVKTKKPVLGMTRFSLQAPGTRNYAYEWVYHELLKHEEIIYLYYDFIRLKLNEKDLGIYAVEEHFGQHVLEHNDRPHGAILRWNPNLYWEWRIDELQGTYLDEQYSDYATSFVEPYEGGTVEDDPELVATYQKGAQLLEAFRRGEKKTSEVFDVLKMARFHAIIDLVGGQHSLDWSDVKFFYNSETGKVEPVGYESFSVRKTESIAGQRIPSEYDQNGFNYHDQLFSDPVFFKVYIEELERIADEEYFNNFIKVIQSDLDKKMGVLAHEFPYRKFTFDPYFENIELIRHNLELPKAFHAFTEEKTDSTVRLSLSPVSDFPIEIISLVVDDKDEFLLDSVFVLPAKARNTYAHYFDIFIDHDSEKLKNLKLKARIPGSKNVFEVIVDDLPAYLNATAAIDEMPAGNSTLATAINDSVSFFKGDEITISEVITFPDSNHTLIIFPGQEFNFTSTGKIITHGNIEMVGGEEEDEMITCSSPLISPLSADASPLVYIYLLGGKMECRNVQFIGSENVIYSNEAYLDFRNCLFSDIRSPLIRAEKSTIVVNHCASGSMDYFGVFDRCLVRFNDFQCVNGSTFLQGSGSDIDMLRSSVSGYVTVASLSRISTFSTWDSFFSASASIADLDDASEFKAIGSVLEAAQVGFRIDRGARLPGSSGYTLYKTTTRDILKMEERQS